MILNCWCYLNRDSLWFSHQSWGCGATSAIAGALPAAPVSPVLSIRGASNRGPGAGWAAPAFLSLRTPVPSFRAGDVSAWLSLGDETVTSSGHFDENDITSRNRRNDVQGGARAARRRGARAAAARAGGRAPRATQVQPGHRPPGGPRLTLAAGRTGAQGERFDVRGLPTVRQYPSSIQLSNASGVQHKDLQV